MNKRAILVVGPPRSGTSVVSHVLSELGVHFGDPARFVDPDTKTYNPIFFELLSLNDLNDEVFARFGTGLGRADWIPMREDFDDALVTEFASKIRSLLESEFGDSPTIGLKDTRFCFTLPLWDRALLLLGYEASYVLVRRKAQPTFTSNQVINQSSDAVNFRLVAQASLLARHFVEGRPHISVRYEALLANPREIVGEMCSALGLDKALVGAARKVIRKELDHQGGASPPSRFRYLSEVIDAATISPDEHLFYREILQAGVSAGEEHVARLADALGEREKDLSALAQAAEAAAAQVDDLNRAVAAANERIADLSLNVEERDNRIAGMAEALRNRDGRISHLERDLADREAQVGSLVRELGALEERLAATQETVAARDEQLHVMQNSILEREGLVERDVARRMFEDSVSWRVPRPGYLLLTLTGRLRRLLSRGDAGLPGIAVHGPIRANLDWPPPGKLTIVSDTCTVSGWSADIEKHCAAPVRVAVGSAIHQPDARDRPDVQRVFAPLPVRTGFAAMLDPWPGLYRVALEVYGADGEWAQVRSARILRLPRIFGASYWREGGPLATAHRVFASMREGALQHPRSAVGSNTSIHASVRTTVDWPPADRMSVVYGHCAVSGWSADPQSGKAGVVRVIVDGRTHVPAPRDRSDVQRAFAPIAGIPLASGFAVELDLRPGVHEVGVELRGPQGEWILVRHARVLSLPRMFHAQYWRDGAFFAPRRAPPPRTPSYTIGSVHTCIDWPPPQDPTVAFQQCVVSGWSVDLDKQSAAGVRVRAGRKVREARRTERQDVQSVFETYALPVNTGFAVKVDLPLGVQELVIEVFTADRGWVEVRRARILRLPKAFSVQYWREGRGAATAADGTFVHGSLLVNVDKPSRDGFTIVPESCVVSGWGVDLESATAAKVRVVVGRTVHQPHLKAREDVQRAFGRHSEVPLETGFAVVLALPLGVFGLAIEVQTNEGQWVAVRRATLLRLPFMRGATRRTVGLSYSAFVRQEKKEFEADLPDIRRHMEIMAHKPTFTVVVDARVSENGLDRTLRSIQGQWYPPAEIYLLGGSARQAAPHRGPPLKLLREFSLSPAEGEFLVVVQSGELLSLRALYEFASAVNQHPDADLFYGDEDSIDVHGPATMLAVTFGRGARAFMLEPVGRRFDPFHKPEWSPDYLETFNYIGFAACYRNAIVRECLPASHRYDLALRFTERSDRIRHLDRVLGHRMARRASKAEAPNAGAAADLAALEGRLARTGRRGKVEEHPVHKGCYEISLELASAPLVSIILPTAGRTVTIGERNLDLVVNVISQIRQRSTYSKIEIVVVDNGDLSEAQLRFLEDARCRRITYTEPIFNIAKKLNLGAAVATGELLLLLNDDIEILTPSWIERMVEHFEKPHVGVVGGKLLYPDGLTQHVGVVHNFGNPDHVRRLYPGGEAGYFFSTCGVRNFSAVTGACMMVRATVYRDVGGYSPELAVSYNDADFCLKVREKGLSVVYAPRMELVHMESLSRVASADPEEVRWYHRRWAQEVVADRYYNERFLTVASPTFVPCINRRMI